MLVWHEGFDYPNPEALARSLRGKKTDCAKSTASYIAAALVMTAAVFIASQEWMVVLGGAIAVAAIFARMLLRWRSYNKMLGLVSALNFSWTAGKVQNRWKRQVFDLSSGPTYQIGICNEWVECDMTTYNQAVIGKLAVLIRNGESAYGIMIPENESHKAIKRIARAAS